MQLLGTIEEVFALRLKELRGDLSQFKMAERLGTTQSTYQRWESGKFLPQADTRAEIAIKTGKMETWFFLDPDLTTPTNEQILARISEIFSEKEKPKGELAELFGRLNERQRAHYIKVLKAELGL